LALNEVDFVKARLTAFAVETEQFSRDDIYTLFVTTRIINFLKGLPLSDSTTLAELMARPWPDRRTQIGFELLKQLTETGRLFFATSQGLIENQKFRPDLFARVLREIGVIRCQNGGKISVDDFAKTSIFQQPYPALGKVTQNLAPTELGSREISPP
jgi:hypothetical protein